MQIHNSNNPAKAAGEYITKAIQQHKGDVLCLLSGGSALEVVEYIKLQPSYADNCTGYCGEDSEGGGGGCQSCRICPSPEELLAQNIITGGESAVSLGEATSVNEEKSTSGKNSECRTIFMMGDERVSRESSVNNSLQLLRRYVGRPIAGAFIPTIPVESETATIFAMRTEKIFKEIFSELKNPKVIALLGLGTDGHTAGIFPLAKESFEETYRGDSIYVPVHLEGLKIDSRASFSPDWLIAHVDEMVGFVAGESKRTILESLMMKEQRELHERPAELLKQCPNTHIFTDITL